MKNTDIAMVILIAAISVVASYLIGNAILGDPNNRVENISYMDPISSDIEQPDLETFNPYTLNPTVEIYVGNCGPMEKWNADKRVCEPKDTEEKDSDESSNEDSSTTGDE